MPESLITRLRGNSVGAAVPVTVIRGTSAVDVTVTVRERQRLRGIVRLRVFLSGRASDALDALRRRLTADQNLEIVDRAELAEAVVTLPH